MRLMPDETPIGRAPEDLTLPQRSRLAGQFAALEIYSPAETPLRRIQATGASAEECARLLQARGLDPRRFEFVRLTPPFA
jgi:hypothetical protein